MATFDGQIITRTRIRLDRDSFQPGMGILTPSPFTEDALVHGNSNRQIVGNHFDTITKNQTINVLQNETYTIGGSRTHTVIGNYTRVIIGIYTRTLISNHITVNLAPRINTFVAVKVEIHCGPKNTSEPTLFQRLVTNNLKYGIVKFDGFALKTEIIGKVISFVVSKSEFGLDNTHGWAIVNKAKGLKNELGAMKNEIKALKSAVEGMQMETGPITLHVQSTTIHILVIGVNQVW